MNDLLLDNDNFIVDSRRLTKKDLIEVSMYIAEQKVKNKLDKTKVHILARRSGDWANVREGAKRAYEVVRSKAKAIAIAKRLKGNAEIIIHTKNGQVDKRIPLI